MFLTFVAYSHNSEQHEMSPCQMDHSFFNCFLQNLHKKSLFQTSYTHAPHIELLLICKITFVADHREEAKLLTLMLTDLLRRALGWWAPGLERGR
jgi:hypothetical protein